MIKVLQIIDGKSFGGICKLLQNVSKYLNNNIKFDYLTASNICNEWYNLNVDRGKLKNRIIYNIKLYRFLKNNKYDIIHINSGAFFFTFSVALVSKLSGVKRIVVHSHNTYQLKIIKKVLAKFLMPLYNSIVNKKLSCSKAAGKSLYLSNNFIIIKNGIEINKYRFNKKTRDKYRKKFKLNDKTVYGHVGRFDAVKNHEFIINLFYEIQKNQNAILLLVGDGVLKNNIEKKVKDMGIDNKVLFFDFCNNVDELLNCMDYFLFPSLHEGLPVSLIEAQTSGLTIFASSNITDEVILSDNYYKFESFNIDEWINVIKCVKICNRVNSYKKIEKSGYDIINTTKQLEKIYKELMK